MYGIERYLNVRSAYGPSFGPEGDRLCFRLDTTGTPQLWSLTAAGAWPDQHTFFEERVTFADYSPERQEVVFGTDTGGNERTQFHRLDLVDGTITDLTQHPDAKHRWGGWSHDGEQFAFASNRRDESVFDVYVQDRDAAGDEAERVYEGDGWLSLAGWSPDDSQLLVHQAYSGYDGDLYTLDVESGEVDHLTPHEGRVRYNSPNWGPDGEHVYLVTDRATDTLRLERLAVDAGEFTIVDTERRDHAGDEWNVGGLAVDEESRRIVYGRNVDGYTEWTAGELVAPDRIDPFPDPDLPRGVSGGVSFGPDGDRFAVTLTADTENANVYVVDIRSGETERWTDAPTAGITRETFVESELVHYPTFDGREIPAFFALPETDTGTSETPVIVDIHGGPESQRRPSFNSVKQYLLANGYAVFEPNVRGSSGYGKSYAALDDVENRMDSVRDLKAAVEWLHDHPAVDPDRIVAMGGSYGGFMVLAALTEYPELWAAGVDIVGIANFVTFLENTGEWRRELREAEYGSLDEDRDFLESISPINRVAAIDAPLFVLHGENDPRVPVDEAEQIADEAREQGVPVEKLVFDDEGHGITKLGNRIEAYQAIVEFLAEHVT
ncbi:S9 family peptidase [Halohasta salina]|uniref:S9 family peptidase n=1 Tax=Halohasta salina TaxID=2961621 RepID=UPI0020A3D008|nr:S9 family peptidase [Halohasta salina]